MADDKITTIIKCQNIAPIENLTREIKSNSLKMGVFANNGSGKTFLSRLFRLTEKQDELILDENGKSPTDKLLTFGKNNGIFSFKITDKDGIVKEDFSISVNKGQIPTIPNFSGKPPHIRTDFLIGNTSINLGGLDIGMTKHFTDGFDWDTF